MKENEIRAVQLFKEGWQAAKYPQVMDAGSVQMPRERYARCVAYACHKRAEEMQNASFYEAALAVMDTAVGNPPGLLALLKKDGFLRDASATETADALLEMLRKK